MTTSTRKIFNIMQALGSPPVDNISTDTTSPLTKPPSIPIPGKPKSDQEMSEVLANCLGSEKKPGNAPR